MDGVQQMRSGRSERLRDAVQRRHNIPLMGVSQHLIRLVWLEEMCCDLI